MNPSSSLDQLNKQREKYRARLATALEEDDDPLASYDVFIKWIQDNYPSNIISQSGLLEVLEEATRQFKDDVAYKGDLRYLKLWSLYASHVEDPATVYAYLLANNIGIVYAQMYEDYANSLERSGRISEAENIYRRGIQRPARPLERLKKRYAEFQKRAAEPSQPTSSPTAILWKDAPPNTQALRRNPFKNYPPSESAAMLSPPVHQTAPTSAASSSAPHNRYAPMLAPPVPGKRPEKLRFNLSLLFTEEGVEYSMPEARARSMGLLGKKWGPPPQAEIAHRLNDEGSRSTRNFARRGAEPTVTLMTKEALADVFEMYNSPEKSMRFGAVAGSKHAPVRKIEPITPIAPMQLHARALSNENAKVPAKTPTFRPFVDENANRKENATPAPPPKFKPFVDAEPPSRLPTFTPDVGRRALHVKDMATPLAAPRAKTGENAQSFKNTLRHIPEDGKHPVVFTPAGAAQQNRPRARPDVFIDEQSGSESDNVLRSSASSSSMRSAVEVPSAAKFTPFVDSRVPFKVFSRPPAPGEDAPSQRSAFMPFVDGASTAVTPRPALRERVPLHPFVPKMREPEAEPEPELEPEDDEEDDSMFDDEQDAYGEVDDTPIVPLDEGEVDSEYDEPNSYQPLGGRLGQFEVMTPIAERTFEYTMSTRGGTPHEAEKVFVHEENAVEAAELLAAEVRADLHAVAAAEAEAAVEEGTGALSLQDTVAVASTFNPPNPCNPFDPPIISTLMSLVPLAFHDWRSDKIDLLESLQKFAKKKSHRTSGNSASRVGDVPDSLHIALAGRPFAVIDKLGEGGFGAVFEAKDLSMNQRSEDDDDDKDEDDEDEDADNMVALKVVKPRNIWEFCVLRRVHSALSSDLRRSVISPQALYAFRDESFLVLELCNQGTLLDIVNRAGPAGVSQAGACLDELLVVFFAIELMRLIEGLHATGFIHGDFKIDNCLLRLEDVPGPASAWNSVYQPSGEGGWRYKGIKMIDFGRTIDTRLFPRGQRFIAEWPADARDCLEIREGRPWTFQTDYYGLAGVIYCMLYGKYIEATSVVPVSSDRPRRYKLATPFKRYWQTDLWTRLFDLLLNPCLVHPDGHLPLCDELGELRTEMETWLQANCNRASNSLKGLLKKIGIAVLGGKGG